MVTGEYQAYRQVSPVQALWSTRYGIILLIKVALVAAMLAAAPWPSVTWPGHGRSGARRDRAGAWCPAWSVRSPGAWASSWPWRFVLGVTAGLVASPGQDQSARRSR